MSAFTYIYNLTVDLNFDVNPLDQFCVLVEWQSFLWMHSVLMPPSLNYIAYTSCSQLYRCCNLGD